MSTKQSEAAQARLEAPKELVELISVMTPNGSSDLAVWAESLPDRDYDSERNLLIHGNWLVALFLGGGDSGCNLNFRHRVSDERHGCWTRHNFDDSCRLLAELFKPKEESV